MIYVFLRNQSADSPSSQHSAGFGVDMIWQQEEKAKSNISLIISLVFVSGNSEI